MLTIGVDPFIEPFVIAGMVAWWELLCLCLVVGVVVVGSLLTFQRKVVSDSFLCGSGAWEEVSVQPGVLCGPGASGGAEGGAAGGRQVAPPGAVWLRHRPSWAFPLCGCARCP